MRVTFNMKYDQRVNAITSTQEKLMQASARLERQTKILTPADDPSGAARGIALDQSITQTDQYQTNNKAVKNSLNLQETVITSIKGSVQQARTLALSLGNGSYSVDDRKSVTTQLENIRDQVFDLMNSRDELGGFLFSGFKDQTQSYSLNKATGKYEFKGDEGVKELKVALSVSIPANASGKTVFEGIDKRFETTAPVVTAPVTATTVDVTNQSVFDSFFRQNYDATATGDNSVRVALTAGAPDTYEVFVGGSAVAAASGPFVAGEAIEFQGMSIAMDAAVVGGQVEFDLAPPEKTNILDTLTELINQVNSGISDEQLSEIVKDAIAEMDKASLKMGYAQSAVGGSINVLDSIFGSNEDLQIATKSHRADVVEIDYVEAITELTKQETALKAAQATFSKVTALSLFDYIR